MKLNERETATVLAALRMFQRAGIEGDRHYRIAVHGLEHFAEVKPLGTAEIDKLCERINTED